MIRIHASRPLGTLQNFWNHIHFHPTDAIEDDWGRAILDEVAADGVARSVRMYAMLEDIVTMDAAGKLHFDFTENDVRMDYMLSRGFEIFLSYNYMPPCITDDPTSLGHANKKSTRYKGKRISTARLADDALWEEVCYEYTRHIVERYGLSTVEKWYLQCYNEPDHVNYFVSAIPEESPERLEEYLRLYRGFSRAITRVSPTLRAGGPASAGNIPFLDGFLAAVKREGLKLDFFTGHAYGTGPDLLNAGARPFATANTTQKIEEYQKTLDRYFPDLEIVIDEWGAAYSGFYDREECPQLLFREGSEYAAYYAKTVDEYLRHGLRMSRQMICLSGQHDLPCDFSGCRNFMGIHHVKKPIYNAYALAARLGETRLDGESDVEHLTVLATARKDGGVAALLAYAHPNFVESLARVEDTVCVEGVTGDVCVRVWCIDEEHTNPYKYSLARGWGDCFDAAQIEELRRVGTLSPVLEKTCRADGAVEIPVSFTSNALLLVEVLP